MKLFYFVTHHLLFHCKIIHIKSGIEVGDDINYNKSHKKYNLGRDIWAQMLLSLVKNLTEEDTFSLILQRIYKKCFINKKKDYEILPYIASLLEKYLFINFKVKDSKKEPRKRIYIGRGINFSILLRATYDHNFIFNKEKIINWHKNDTSNFGKYRWLIICEKVLYYQLMSYIERLLEKNKNKITFDKIEFFHRIKRLVNCKYVELWKRFTQENILTYRIEILDIMLNNGNSKRFQNFLKSYVDNGDTIIFVVNGITVVEDLKRHLLYIRTRSKLEYLMYDDIKFAIEQFVTPKFKNNITEFFVNLCLNTNKIFHFRLLLNTNEEIYMPIKIGQENIEYEQIAFYEWYEYSKKLKKTIQRAFIHLDE